MLVDLILKYIKVIGGCNGDDVFVGMPGGVEDFLAEVQAVNADLVFATFTTDAHLAGFQDRPRFAVLPRRLQRHVALCIAVEHSEEIVVGTCHDHAVGSIPDAFEFVEDAIVFVQRAQFTS